MKLKLTGKQKQFLAIGVVAVCGLGFVYFKFFWTPISERIVKATDKLESVTRKIQKATRQAARLPKLEEELAKLNDQAVEAEKRLPRKKGAPNILVTVNQLAAKHRIVVKSFTPGGKAKRKFFTELSFPLAISGRFHDVGMFLAAISMEERIFNVVNVNFGVASESGDMAVTMTLVSYQYKG